jgi:hypothetical protein
MEPFSSAASIPTARKYGYRLIDEPFIEYDRAIDVMCITSGTAFQHNEGGKVVGDQGQYHSLFPKPKAIMCTIRDILRDFTDDEWQKARVNDPEQLSKTSAGIVRTYDRDQDHMSFPLETNARASRTRVLLKCERAPRTARYGFSSINPSTATNPKSSRPASSVRSASVRIPDTFDNDSLHNVGPFEITIDGTVENKDTQEIYGLSERCIEMFSENLADSLPLIGDDLKALAKSKTYGRNMHVREIQHGPSRRKLERLARAAVKHWHTSLVPDHIDPGRVNGSESKYRAPPVPVTGIPGLDSFEVQVVADYSRITDDDSRATTEGGSVR